MITGIVRSGREAIILLTLLDAGGNAHQCNALVDTGFDDWITLSAALIRSLSLQWRRFGRGILADGSESPFHVYEATVLWDGEMRIVPVYQLEAEPTIGMSLMYGYELVLPILDGATFTLRRITNP